MKYTNCWVPRGGYPTQDGYLRVMTHVRSLGGKLKMWHRLVWEIVKGPIPKGYEVNHLCKNRKCCNVDHLEVLTSSEHRTKDNTGRYQGRRLEVYALHLANPDLTQQQLATYFGLAQSSVSVILRDMHEANNKQTKIN